MTAKTGAVNGECLSSCDLWVQQQRSGSTIAIVWGTPDDDGVTIDARVVSSMDEGVDGTVANHG